MTTNTARPPLELLDYIRELTQAHVHREHYTTRLNGTWYGQDHVTQAPALIDQLRYASPSGQGVERGAGGYESRPAASLPAVETLLRIDDQAARWVRVLGEDDPGDTAACVRRVGALAASQPEGIRRDILADARRWWVWARIQAGWDSPAWRPDNTCPLCGIRGALRVKLADGLAYCNECHETWAADTIGLLADHIRSESGSHADPHPAEAAACWCPWPRPADQDQWPPLCSSCGSRWCHRVLTPAATAAA